MPPKNPVMFAAVPTSVRPLAFGLLPPKNAAWLSCAVREPVNIFNKGESFGYTTFKTSNRVPIRQRQCRHLGEHRGEGPLLLRHLFTPLPGRAGPLEVFIFLRSERPRRAVLSR